MEASALPRTAGLPRPRLVVPVPLLRLRSDDQLVELFRGGCDDAFRAIYDRYRGRLMAYARQMLGGSAADAEDALQEVFVRAHSALLASTAPISLRAWLYRIAHNRCIDQLRRPPPIPSLIAPGAQPALCRGARHDPPAEAERSEDLRRLVSDVHALPEQQRSALLMRELQGLSYEELALALGISVAAVKSLLLRARGGVLDAADARQAPCAEIRLELVAAHDRGVRASGRARRHMRECDRCLAYRGELRAVSRRVAALAPAGPLGHLGLVFGLGGGGGGGLAAGGSGAVLGGAGGVTASKVAALVCCAALVGGADALRSQAPRPVAHAHRAARAAPGATPAPGWQGAAQVAVAALVAPAAPRPSPPNPQLTPRTASAQGPVGSPLTGQDTYGAATPATPTSVPTGTLGLDAAAGPDVQAGPTGGTPASAEPGGGPAVSVEAGGGGRPGPRTASDTASGAPTGSDPNPAKPALATATTAPGAETGSPPPTPGVSSSRAPASAVTSSRPLVAS